MKLYYTKREPPKEMRNQLKSKTKSVVSEIHPEISKSEINKSTKTNERKNRAPGKDRIKAINTLPIKNRNEYTTIILC